MQILEGVINISQIYLNLLKSGNILFKNWSATIYCDKFSVNTIAIDFASATQQKQTIFGARRVERNTADSINKTIKFLQKCYTEWIAHVDEKRAFFTDLNHFRVDQIVTMRTELAKLNPKSQQQQHNEENLTSAKGLLDLLYDINRAVNVPMLKLANEYAFEKRNEQSSKAEEPDEKTLEAKQLEEVLRELVNDGFSPSLVMEAYQMLNTSDKEQLAEYCLNNMNDEHDDTKPANDNEAVDTDKKKKNVIPDTMLNLDQIKMSLFEKLLQKDGADLSNQYDTVWTSFVEYMDSDFDGRCCHQMQL